MIRPKLSIIIINYNTPKLVYNCIESIEKLVKFSHEIIVVDNGSKKDSRIQNADVRKLVTPDCNFQLLTLETNLGFGSGNNAGAKHANGEYIWFLNSDTLLVNDSAQKLMNFLDKHKKIGAVSPLLYHQDGKLQKNFYAKFQTLGNITLRRYNSHDIDLSKEYFYTDIVVGAAMMMRRELFEIIGGFDENIFMYLEDDDLCKRIENEGYRNAVLNIAKIVHLEGKSIKRSKDRKKLYYASQTYFWRKHNGRVATLIMRALRWPYKLIKTI